MSKFKLLCALSVCRDFFYRSIYRNVNYAFIVILLWIYAKKVVFIINLLLFSEKWIGLMCISFIKRAFSLCPEIHLIGCTLNYIKHNLFWFWVRVCVNFFSVAFGITEFASLSSRVMKTLFLSVFLAKKWWWKSDIGTPCEAYWNQHVSNWVQSWRCLADKRLLVALDFSEISLHKFPVTGLTQQILKPLKEITILVLSYYATKNCSTCYIHKSSNILTIQSETNNKNYCVAQWVIIVICDINFYISCKHFHSDETAKFFCFQVLEHQIKTRCVE